MKYKLTYILFVLVTSFVYSYFDEANIAYNFLHERWRVKPPQSDNYWDNQNERPNTPHLCGWMGTHAAQSSLLLYEQTEDAKYLADALKYSLWLRDHFILSSTLTLCETNGDGNETTVNNWSDDAGWMSCFFIQMYKYTGVDEYIDLAYDITINADNEWELTSTNWDTLSKGIKYYSFSCPPVCASGHTCNNVVCTHPNHVTGTPHTCTEVACSNPGHNHVTGHHEDKLDKNERVTIYIASSIIACIELYQIFREKNPAKALEVIELACRYYNFVEDELRSDGSAPRFQAAHYIVPENIYAHGRRTDDDLQDNGRDNAQNVNDCFGFTFAQMAMAVVHKMFEEVHVNDATILPTWIISPLPNFGDEAVTIANTLITPHTRGGLAELRNYPNGVTGPQVNMLINARDGGTNSFALYWWIKYIVPLNSNYGEIIQNTATGIIDNYLRGGTLSGTLTGNVIGPCWNSNGTDGNVRKCQSSESRNFVDNSGNIIRDGIMVRHSTGTNYLAAAALISSGEEIKEPSYWRNKISNEGVKTRTRILNTLID